MPRRPASPFAVATLVPAALLALGAFTGGLPLWAALVWMTLLGALLDRLVATAGPGAAGGVEFPAGDRLAAGLGAIHFVLLALAVLALSGATGLSAVERVGAFAAFGLFLGQVGNANAHELIHRTDPVLARLGKWVFISMAYGHHVTAHPRIHHRHVGTAEDPATAQLGEGFWSYLPRAWWGAFRAGWEIESAIAAVKGRRLEPWRHPYAEYLAGTAGVAALALLLGGRGGLLAWILLCAFAQVQILVSDYVQHYGLRRAVGPDGRAEPVAPWHSWNAPHWFSAGLMLNAPRHSDHHVHPARPYPALELPDDEDGPRLPHPLPVMGAIALVPPLWHRMMDRRARAWQKRIDSGALARAAVVARTEAARRARRAGGGLRTAVPGTIAAGAPGAADGRAEMRADVRAVGRAVGRADAIGRAVAAAAAGAAPAAEASRTAPDAALSATGAPVPQTGPGTPEARRRTEPPADPKEVRLRAALRQAIAACEIDGAAPEIDGAAPEIDGAAPEIDGAAPEIDGAAPEMRTPGSPARAMLTERPEPRPVRADDPIAAAVVRAIAATDVIDARVERQRRAALLPVLARPEPEVRNPGLIARAAAAARALGRGRGATRQAD